MDVTLSTSVILVVAVALWLIWVAPYVLRSRRMRLATPEAAIPAAAAPAAAKAEVLRMEVRAQKTPQPQETAMKPHVKESAIATSRTPAPLKIRYGRTAAAGVGLLALLVAVVGTVLKLAGAAPALLPVTAAVVFVAMVVLLRTLAVRGRKAKVEEAFREAMGSAPSPRASRPTTAATGGSMAASPRTGTPAADRKSEAEVFDADGGSSALPPAPAPAPVRLTAAELRTAALEVAAQAAVAAGGVPEQWQPVEVPKPRYVAAAKAERPAPAPLQLPEAPKPAVKTSIKASEAAVIAPAAVVTKEPAEPAVKLPAKVGAAVQGARPQPASALGNLDDILQRRRA